jgi:hypothetical protein
MQARYRASLDAGGDPAVIGPWIAETQAKKITAQAEIRTSTGRRQLSQDDIAAIVAAFADLAQVVREADPADKADLYAQLKLTLTYQPGQRLVEATVKPRLDMRKGLVSEGGLEPPRRGNFPESGKFHVIRIPDRNCVFKYLLGIFRLRASSRIRGVARCIFSRQHRFFGKIRASALNAVAD